jgi:CRISPR-associated protein Csm1
MDDTVLKVALAGLLHDIGKFSQEGMIADPEFINNHRQLYQPFYDDRFTHEHVVYTAAFVDHIEKLLPRDLSKPSWGLDEPFVSLAAGHHKPDSALKWVIATADRLSSGWDRSNFEIYNRAIAYQNYRQTRLKPLFEDLLVGDKKKSEWFYPLKELSPLNIFPIQKAKEAITDERAKTEYKSLFDEFIYALEKLLHKDLSLSLWLDHLDSLLLIYTSMIPAARAGKVVPDVSLYDHARAVSALSAAIYLYHRTTSTLNVEAVCDSSIEKFLIVGGDFYGIQDFIFSDGGENAKSRAKLLRGRSFAVSLYCELVADLICRRIDLPSTSVLLNAAGKFTIIAPNTIEVRQAVAEAERQVNDWLIAKTFGQSAIGISIVTASANDFVEGKFPLLWDKLGKAMAKRKFQKVTPDKLGVVKDYLDSFDNTLTPPICSCCGKRPADRKASEKSKAERAICPGCRDHIFLGAQLVRNPRIAIVSKDAEIFGDAKLLEPIFDEYQVAFIGGDLKDMARSGQLYKYWDISIDPSGKLDKEVSVRFIGGYVPVYRDDDMDDTRIIESKRSERTKEELINQIDKGDIKTFSHIAAKAMNIKRTEKKDVKYLGIQALGILKADVDQLGLLMACGLKEKDLTLSRIATLSRQLHFFFSVYLPYLLVSDERLRDVYTVFAGGDDLFLIGPWNAMLDLAELLRERFGYYTCENPEVHFSAGFSLNKPNVPLSKFAESAEAALEAAKKTDEASGKRGDKISVFGETVTWTDFVILRRIRDRLSSWRDSGVINSATIYRLNDFIEMAEMEKRILHKQVVRLEDMNYLKWPAYFSYQISRNIGKAIDNAEERRKVQEEFGQAAKWLKDFGGRLRIALWDVIYNNR